MSQTSYVVPGALLGSILLSPGLPAQQNPFKLPKPAVAGAEVTYRLTGDLQGTATVAFDGDRYVRSSKSTMTLMGKTSAMEDWILSTPDSTYRADLTRKQGYAAPNLLPLLAKAYDGLDGAGKKRLHQNLQDMGSMLSQAIGLGNVMAGEKLGKKSYAGQECEERRFGGLFSVCQMEKAPLVLHTNATLVCMNFEETATEVKLSAPAGDRFARPDGVTFQPDPNMQNADSLTRGFVGYLASQELSDSIAKVKAEMTKARGEAAAKGQTEPTAEEKQAMNGACEMLKNYDMGKVMASAAAAWQKAMVEAMKNEAKDQATRGIKGLIKKPKIP